MQKNVKSIANCWQEPHPEDWLRQAHVTSTQEEDEDEDSVRTRSRTSNRVMSVMNRADNTGAKNLVIMIVKSISIHFEDNAGVIVNVKEI